MLLLPGVRLHHPPNCAALYQEAPWQLTMNIGIEQGARDCTAHSSFIATVYSVA